MTTMKSNGTRMACILIAGLLSACTSTTPRYDASFGDTLRIAVAQQTAYPNAALNADPVAGIDGAAARGAVERYERSFREPPAPPAALTIGVSGIR